MYLFFYWQTKFMTFQNELVHSLWQVFWFLHCILLINYYNELCLCECVQLQSSQQFYKRLFYTKQNSPFNLDFVHKLWLNNSNNNSNNFFFFNKRDTVDDFLSNGFQTLCFNQKDDWPQFSWPQLEVWIERTLGPHSFWAHYA